MRITEVMQPSNQTLTEQFGLNNKTGFLTEDLVKIYRTHLADAWSEPMTADELLAEMDQWDAE